MRIANSRASLTAVAAHHDDDDDDDDGTQTSVAV